MTASRIASLASSISLGSLASAACVSRSSVITPAAPLSEATVDAECSTGRPNLTVYNGSDEAVLVYAAGAQTYLGRVAPNSVGELVALKPGARYVAFAGHGQNRRVLASTESASVGGGSVRLVRGCGQA